MPRKRTLAEAQRDSVPKENVIAVQYPEGSDERVAMLFVDVNLGNEDQQNLIVIYEGDTPEDLADKFAQENNLNQKMRGKLVALLTQEIALCKEKI